MIMINPIDGSLQVYAANPRNKGVDVEDAKTIQGVALWGDLFKNISKMPADSDERRGFVVFPSPSQPQTYDISAELQAIDLKPAKNSLNTQKALKTAQLSLTPGQHFQFDLYFYRDIIFTRDHLNITLQKENKTEKYFVELTNTSNKDKGKYSNWKSLQGRLNLHEKEKLTIDVQLPSNISRGWWNLHIITSLNETDNVGEMSDSESVINGLRVI